MCINVFTLHCQTKFMDVITINRYYSWYADPGHTETIPTQLATDLELWYETHGKPMMLTEYGAGTVAGLHRVCRGVKRRSKIAAWVLLFAVECQMPSIFPATFSAGSLLSLKRSIST